MKILYHHRTRAEDGQAVHIRSLIEAFEAEGHQVIEQALVSRAQAETSGKVSEQGESALWKRVAQVPRFARELMEYGYTLPARSMLLRAARRERPDFLYERYAFGNAAGVQAAAKLGLPIVLEVNSPMVLELSRTRGLTFPRLGARVETRIFKGADRVCVVTQVLGDMLIDMGVEPERILVTPNGVHPELYARPDRAAARADLGIAETSGVVLGFVGYYRDWHRLDLVIDGLTAPALREAQLVLVGAGPAEAELRARAEERGVAQRVHFAGTRKHAQIPSVLPAFDVALVPAINPYASPLKLHEYMCAGLAVVAPDQPNLREVLRHDENALLVEPGSADQMLAALEQLAGDAAQRERLGRRAAATITEMELTWRGNARRIIQAVEGLR